MAIELSAVRLIAPWFGTSQAVWTSAIGAVLVALSVGYLLGRAHIEQMVPFTPLAEELEREMTVEELFTQVGQESHLAAFRWWGY